MRALTREQVESRKAQAVKFTQTVLGDLDRADEIAAESLEDYAQRRKIQITNPIRRLTMARRKTIEDYRLEIADLKDENTDLQEENEGLQDQLDQIVAVASGEEEEEEEEEDEDDQDQD